MWERTGPVATGGTVFDIATNSTGSARLATGAGILESTADDWQPVPQSRPLPAIGTLCAAGRHWWAAGLTGGLIRSRGQGWESCWIDQITEPVTCLLPSPRFSADSTLLAGTNGAGILRSTDGGRRWLLSNFGLETFTILALTSATDWSRREYVFAGTLSGVYRSSGGGRAWALTGLEGLVVQALAAGRTFAESGVLLAATESEGLFRSTDGGRTWQTLKADFGGASINVLLSITVEGREQWLAGSDEGHIWRSEDGMTWQICHSGAHSVLTLAAQDDDAGGSGVFLAGLSEAGLLTSGDGGRTWQPHSINGRGLQRLITLTDGRVLAASAQDGVWQSEHGEQWQQLLSASLGRPLFDVVAGGDTVLALWDDGLHRQVGPDWRVVLAPDDARLIALTATPTLQPAWVVSQNGRLWGSTDGGRSWDSMETPFEGQQVLAMIAAQPALALATFDARQLKTTVWRLTPDGWTVWLTQQSKQPPVVQMAAANDEVWLSMDQQLWRWTEGAWSSLTEGGGIIRRIALSPDGTRRYLLVGGNILHPADRALPSSFSLNEAAWQSLALPAEMYQLIDIQIDSRDQLLALDAGGYVWHYVE